MGTVEVGSILAVSERHRLVDTQAGVDAVPVGTDAVPGRLGQSGCGAAQNNVVDFVGVA